MKLADFARLVVRTAAGWRGREHEALRASGARLVVRARAYIGHYQGAVGPFPPWAPLAYATLHGGVTASGRRYPGKIELGYAPPDNPLLRTGHLRGSIEFEMRARGVAVLSHDPVAGLQEFGAAGLPPRAFLGRAVEDVWRREATAVMRAGLAPLLAGRG